MFNIIWVILQYILLFSSSSYDDPNLNFNSQTMMCLVLVWIPDPRPTGMDKHFEMIFGFGLGSVVLAGERGKHRARGTFRHRMSVGFWLASVSFLVGLDRKLWPEPQDVIPHFLLLRTVCVSISCLVWKHWKLFPDVRVEHLCPSVPVSLWNVKSYYLTPWFHLGREKNRKLIILILSYSPSLTTGLRQKLLCRRQHGHVWTSSSSWEWHDNSDV